MYFPTGFNAKKAIEMGRLVVEAVKQFYFYRDPNAYVKTFGGPWTLPAEYDLVSVIAYNPWQLGFAAPGEDSGPSLIDQEMQEVEATRQASSPSSPSFGAFDSEYPMGFVATSKVGKNAYLIFRGTATPQEFVKDAKIAWQRYPVNNFGNVALGFLEVYTACRESFIKSLDGLGNLSLYISGHSLGAALSVLALPDVVNATHFKKPTLYNFGCPRVGDNNFVTAYNALAAGKSFRIANSSDLVTNIPTPAPIMFYSHIDVPVDFNVQANDIGKNHVMETYIDTLVGWQKANASTKAATASE